MIWFHFTQDHSRILRLKIKLRLALELNYFQLVKFEIQRY